MKNKNKNELSNQAYGPNMRNFLDAPINPKQSHSENDSVELPDNVENPIVSNNIAQAEFDYTEESILEPTPKKQ